MLSAIFDISLIFFDHLDLQIIEIDIFYEVILSESRFSMTLKFLDGFIQPDRLAQIKGVTDLIQRAEDLVGAGVIAPILNAGML